MADVEEIDDESWDISREFLKARQRGEAPFCTHPWDSIRMKIDGHTKVCCDDKLPLPRMSFPTARDFHKPTEMWNHPFLQHLRRTMGTGEETALCKLCLSVDKRDPKNTTRRLEARTASKTQFLEMSADLAAQMGRGSLKSFKGRLQDFKLADPDKPQRPFKRDAMFYRFTLQHIDFADLDNVLMFGCRDLAFAPFLAETSQRLEIADSAGQHLSRAERLCQAFDLPVSRHLIGRESTLPLKSETFDGIWVSGRFLALVDGAAWCKEFARLLKREGRLHVFGAPAIGRIARDLAEEPNPLRRQAALTRLTSEMAAPGSMRIVSRTDLRTKLRLHGLKLDQYLPLKAVPAKLSPEEAALLPLLPGYTDLPAEPDGDIDLCLNFSARHRSESVRVISPGRL